jgi:hypothetical protein
LPGAVKSKSSSPANGSASSLRTWKTREAVLGEGVERLFEGALVEIGLLHQLAEVRLAVDELQDLHQVLRKRSGFLVDLGDAFRGLGENRIAIHVSPRLVALSLSVQ